MAGLADRLQAATEQAERLLAQGNAEAAAAMLDPVARAAPQYARAQVCLARALRELGHTEAALARFKAAAEASGRDSARWQELVTELLKAGQKGRARNIAQKAPLRGAEKKALLDLAKKDVVRAGPALGGAPEADLRAVQELVRVGNPDAARDRAEALLAQHPESAFLHNVLGVIALSANDPEIAETRFRHSLRISPNFTGARANLGLALTVQKRTGEAIRLLRQAVADDPASAEARTNLANAYLSGGRFADAASEAAKLLQAIPEDTEALKIRVTALMKIGRHAEALKPLQVLHAAVPEDPETEVHIMKALEMLGREREALDFAQRHMDRSADMRRRYGMLLSQLGRLDEARAALREAIERSPEDADAYMNYGALARWTPDDPMLPALEAFVSRTGVGARNWAAYYALAKARQDLGDDVESFRLLDEANRGQSAISTFDADATRKSFERIAATWTAEVIGALAGSGIETVAPIFVIGMPRSGSTLTEQILAAHPKIVGIGEDSLAAPHFPTEMSNEREALSESARGAAEEMRRAASGGTRIVDKYLNNFMRVGALAAAFPRAVFVHTRRDPRPVALSIYSNAMKVKGHPYSTDLKNIAEYYVMYDQLMQHWKTILQDRIVTVDYETLVVDPEPEIRRLVASVGLEWDNACLKPESVAKRVKTLSLAQVRSGIGTEAMARWKRFEADLEPFSRVLRKTGLL